MENPESERKTSKKRERYNCCVPQCFDVKNFQNHLHQVPKDVERRHQRNIAIKKDKNLNDRMQVCIKHLKPEDYIPTSKFDFL